MDEPETFRTEGSDIEPGATASTGFSVADSFVDLEAYNSSFDVKERKRLPSGIIRSIISGEEVDSTNNQSNIEQVRESTQFGFTYHVCGCQMKLQFT